MRGYPYTAQPAKRAVPRALLPTPSGRQAEDRTGEAHPRYWRSGLSLALRPPSSSQRRLEPLLADGVRQTAIDCGMPYTSHPSTWGAIRSHARWLKQMGTAANQPAR